MKLNRKSRRAWILLLIALPILVATRSTTPTNRAATSPDNSDPTLRTRHYLQAPQAVQQAVVALIPTLRTYGRYWHYVPAINSAQDSKVVRAVVPVIIFKDDLEVTLRGDGSGTVMNVTSASRVGKGDFGENRRHILQILGALDERMGVGGE